MLTELLCRIQNQLLNCSRRIAVLTLTSRVCKRLSGNCLAIALLHGFLVVVYVRTVVILIGAGEAVVKQDLCSSVARFNLSTCTVGCFPVIERRRGCLLCCINRAVHPLLLDGTCISSAVGYGKNKFQHSQRLIISRVTKSGCIILCPWSR